MLSKKHSETAMVWNYRNALLQFKKLILLRHLLQFWHTFPLCRVFVLGSVAGGVVPQVA